MNPMSAARQTAAAMMRKPPLPRAPSSISTTIFPRRIDSLAAATGSCSAARRTDIPADQVIDQHVCDHGVFKMRLMASARRHVHASGRRSGREVARPPWIEQLVASARNEEQGHLDTAEALTVSRI